MKRTDQKIPGIMRRYRIDDIMAEIPSGVRLQLNPDQYRRRREFVTPIADGSGCFLTRATIQFKRNEIIGTDDPQTFAKCIKLGGFQEVTEI